MLGLLRGIVRGVLAWAIGWGLAFVASVLGVVSAPGLDGVGAAYVAAHAIPPEPSVVVVLPVVALGVVGFRAGRSTRTGVTGRIRTLVQSVRGTERNRLRTAAVGGGLLAVGYAASGIAVAFVVGSPAVEAVVGGLVYGLAVGVPTAIVGAFY